MGIRNRSGPRLLALLFAALAPLAAASDSADRSAPTPTPSATLKLHDGRLLHNVRIMSSTADGIVVNADEGLIKVPRANLPDGMAASLPAAPAQAADSGMVMQPFNPDAGQAAPAPSPGPGPAPRPSPTPRPTPNPVFRGCTITSFQAAPFQNVQGTAEVVISNATDSAVVVAPGDITCVTDSGGQLRGRQFVVVGSYPPIIRRRDSVPAHGTLDEQVTFSNDAVQIAAVRWSR